jgi:hypothetical protein
MLGWLLGRFGWLLDTCAASCLAVWLLPLLAVLTIAGRLTTDPGSPQAHGAGTTEGWRLQLWVNLTLFMLKTYGGLALLGALYGAVGLPAAFVGVGMSSFGRRDPLVRSVLAPPSSVLDAVFLCGLLPCLCAPAALVHGMGAGAFAFLHVAFFWQA